MADLCGLLAQNRTRLLTLTGAGGAGKSRLAIELAYEIRSAYSNVWFVDLSTVRETRLVPSAIAQVLDVQETGTRPLQAMVQEVLSLEPSLLLLDNFEQVLNAASFVDDLLGICPALTIVVSSREALNLRSERVYVVEPLPVPDLGRLGDAELTRRVPSVMLFEERARARRATFKLTDEALPAVAEICARLDGLPLAIELAAGQAGVLTPAAILKRLEARAPLIGTVHRDLPARHQTLQAAVAWSYDLLEPEERAVFRRCGVFSGGFTAEAAERLCGGLEDMDALGLLAQLVAKSLVRVADVSDEPRFSFLETIHGYAVDQLTLAGELTETRARHAAYYVELAEDLRESLRGPGMAAALDQLARDYANFRAVFQWASETGDWTTGLRLAAALYRFWIARGPLTEARGWLETALAQCQVASPRVRADALNAAGVIAGIQHDHEPATRFFQESLELWQTVGDTSRQAGAHLNLGLIAYITDQIDEAQRQLERAHELYLGVGDRGGQAKAVGSRARVARQQKDLGRALRLVEESLDLFQAVGDRFGTAQALANLGQVKLDLDDRAGAGVAFRRALEAWRSLGNILDVAECLEGVAAVVADTEPRRAAQLLGAAEALREGSGAPVAAVELSRYAKLVARVKTQLREGAWSEGRGLPIDQAMDLALREDAPKRAGSSVAVQADEGDALAPRDALSPREREIARLIAQGQSNRAIANGLVVSVKTVETHIQHIFRKLHVKNRAEIGVWAARTGLV